MLWKACVVDEMRGKAFGLRVVAVVTISDNTIQRRARRRIGRVVSWVSLESNWNGRGCTRGLLRLTPMGTRLGGKARATHNKRHRSKYDFEFEKRTNCGSASKS